MTSLDDLLRLAGDTPSPPPGFVPAILARVRLKRILASSVLLAATTFLSLDFSARAVVELLGRKWLDLLGGFYEEPALLLSREGSMALLEHFFHGSIPLFLAMIVLFGLTLRHFLRSSSPFLFHSHDLR